MEDFAPPRNGVDVESLSKHTTMTISSCNTSRTHAAYLEHSIETEQIVDAKIIVRMLEFLW
jgi:hypothetical protein